MSIESAGGAPEVGFAYVTLLPSLKGFSSRVQTQLAASGIGGSFSRVAGAEATKAGTRAGGLFSRAFSRSSTAGGAGLPRIFEASFIRNLRTYAFALSGITSLTVGFGLKTASSFQQTRIAFTTMLNSASKANKLFSQLVQFAKKTPFDLPGVVSATQKLLAFGFGAKRIKPILTAIGDTAAGLSLGADGLDRITVAIGQIAAKGRVQSDEILQLTEAGVPALRILANQFGISTAALQTYIGKGLVPANKAIPALLRGLETGTTGIAGKTAKFGGLMAKQAHTLGGQFSNLLDSVKVGLAGAVKTLVPVLQNALPKASKAFSRAMVVAGRDMGEFLHGLGVAKDRSAGVTTAFEQVGSAVRLIAKAARLAIRHANGLFQIAGDVLIAAAAYKTYRTALKLALRAQIALDTAIALSPMGRAARVALILAGALTVLSVKSKHARQQTVGAFVDIVKAVGYLAVAVDEGFKFIIDGMLRFVHDMLHLAASGFGWIPGIGGKLKGAADAFDRFGSGVDSEFDGMISHALNWDNQLSAIFSHATNTIAAFNAVMGSERHGDQNTFRAATAAGKVAEKTGKSAGTGVGTGLGNGINAGAKKVSTAMSSIVNKILGPLRDLKKKAADLAKSVTDAILGDTGFGAILNQTDVFGQTGFGTSVKAIIAGFTNERRDVARFRHQLRVLEKRGLSEQAISEIAGEGLVQGGSVASALIGATRKQLRKISNLRSDTHAAASSIGTDVAGGVFGARIARSIDRTRLAVEKAAKDTSLSNKTVHALGREFKAAQQSVKPYVRVADVDRAEGQRVAAQL